MRDRYSLFFETTPFNNAIKKFADNIYRNLAPSEMRVYFKGNLNNKKFNSDSLKKINRFKVDATTNNLVSNLKDQFPELSDNERIFQGL